ncbi:BhlA/UviB family holin-like peptide [Clostridium massiliamazoniense]|uniref:BhlA/UviB family holin-like peptide n=1 Tax=Clostridium massiliamazoniense TaxID=1347366 RepID=UPI0006D7B404|nr:BhlA/UviB family holin-like peptide [Clostridium massiliamazoniense]
MDSAILKMIISQGIFAILFCYLLIYVLKQNSIREENYQNIIDKLTSTLPVIKEELEEIKNKLVNLK